MFPKKAVGSVVGIGGMAGGIGGVVMSKLGGWLFDSYKYAGIAKSWVEAKAAGLGDYLSNIQALKFLNKKGEVINLDQIELRSLPKEVTEQLQSIDASMFDKLLQLQKPLVAAEMNTSYTIMFAICAVAYLIAWSVMKSLVPKYKAITDL
jgi:ACS family hexuronate transporter-like MFS transporter